jgi:hypothetical protein
MEEENRSLKREVDANVQARDAANQRNQDVLDELAHVGPLCTWSSEILRSLSQAVSKWQVVPMEEIEDWIITTADTSQSEAHS